MLQQLTHFDISKKHLINKGLFFPHAEPSAVQVAVPSGMYSCQGGCRQDERDGEDIPALNCYS